MPSTHPQTSEPLDFSPRKLKLAVPQWGDCVECQSSLPHIKEALGEEYQDLAVDNLDADAKDILTDLQKLHKLQCVLKQMQYGASFSCNLQELYTSLDVVVFCPVKSKLREFLPKIRELLLLNYRSYLQELSQLCTKEKVVAECVKALDCRTTTDIPEYDIPEYITYPSAKLRSKYSEFKSLRESIKEKWREKKREGYELEQLKEKRESVKHKKPNLFRTLLDIAVGVVVFMLGALFALSAIFSTLPYILAPSTYHFMLENPLWLIPTVIAFIAVGLFLLKDRKVLSIILVMLAGAMYYNSNGGVFTSTPNTPKAISDPIAVVILYLVGLGGVWVLRGGFNKAYRSIKDLRAGKRELDAIEERIAEKREFIDDINSELASDVDKIGEIAGELAAELENHILTLRTETKHLKDEKAKLEGELARELYETRVEEIVGDIEELIKHEVEKLCDRIKKHILPTSEVVKLLKAHSLILNFQLEKEKERVEKSVINAIKTFNVVSPNPLRLAITVFDSDRLKYYREGDEVCVEVDTSRAEHLCSPNTKLKGVVKVVSEDTITIELNEVPEPFEICGIRELKIQFSEQPIKKQKEIVEKILENLNESGHTRKSLLDVVLGRKIPDKRKYSVGVFVDVKISRDQNQAEAVRGALEGKEVFLIHGPPGTGKTTVIAEIVCQLLRQNKRILVTSQTNVAVDNVLEKLVEIDEFSDFVVRAGKEERITVERLKEFSSSKIDVNKIRSGRPIVVGGTCIGIRLDQYTRDCTFDVVVIDEASKAHLTEALVPLAMAKEKVIIVGDHKQLPPYWDLDKEEEKQLKDKLKEELQIGDDEANELLKRLKEESVFNWLYDRFKKIAQQGEYYIMLERNYRSVRSIVELVGRTFYNGKLKWYRPDDKSEIQPPVIFVDTSNNPRRMEKNVDSRSWCNEFEAEVVVNCVKPLRKRFFRRGEKNKSIGVIAPYRQQVSLIDGLLKEVGFATHSESLTVATVDSYQGKENDVVVLSLVRSNPGGDIGFLRDWRRLNVALSRAKDTLIVVGDGSTFEEGIRKKKNSRDPEDQELVKILSTLLREVEKVGQIVRSEEVSDLLSKDASRKQG